MSYLLETIAHLDHAKDFARLHRKFTQFNPLKVLRVDQFEIRHSNVLAWLLDPNENHQMGSFFIKKLVSRLVLHVENEEKVDDLDLLSFLHASFFDTEVYREVKTGNNRYIDLLVVVPSQRIVLVIENKFHAGESQGQLEDYLTYAQDQYHMEGYTIIPVFLTLRRDMPSYPDYLMLDYNDVLDIITSHLELNREGIADHVYDFLTFYTVILKEELVEDDEAMELALDIYQVHKRAIDLLFLSQHMEYSNQARYSGLFQRMNELPVSHKESLKKIYDKKKQTIDYIFKMGSNVLREAFLSFVQLEEIPEEVYKAHVTVPNFILPQWTDFAETMGEPESGYWLGNGLIIWFERTWNERLKITIELGPIPFEKRLKFLTELENQGMLIRQSAKSEERKYTKIYTQTIDITDWANKNVIIQGMEQLYHDPTLEDTFKMIALAMESMKEEMQEEIDQLEDEIHGLIPSKRIPKEAFLKFAKAHGISEEIYRYKGHTASFLMPIFRELEQTYGKTRINWWGYNSTFVYWFQRLKDDRLLLKIELGPLQPEQRLALIEKLEEQGMSFPTKAKHIMAKYTTLFSKSKVVMNWDDEEEVYEMMDELFMDPENQERLQMIERVGG